MEFEMYIVLFYTQSQQRDILNNQYVSNIILFICQISGSWFFFLVLQSISSSKMDFLPLNFQLYSGHLL